MMHIGKVVAVVASIALFAMPTATMPLHCVLKAPSGEKGHPCHMMGVSPSADQINAVPSDHSCCAVSAARPESITVPRARADSGIVVPPTSVALLFDLPAAPVVNGPFDWNVQSPGGSPQAVLCTFLI